MYVVAIHVLITFTFDIHKLDVVTLTGSFEFTKCNTLNNPKRPVLAYGSVVYLRSVVLAKLAAHGHHSGTCVGHVTLKSHNIGILLSVRTMRSPNPCVYNILFHFDVDCVGYNVTLCDL